MTYVSGPKYKLVLSDGSTVTGRGNYADNDAVEIFTSDGEFRTIERALIERASRI